jgi:transposase-like protein
MDQEKRTRRQHSPEDKERILRLHRVEKKPISEIGEAEGIHPTLFCQWQKTFFEKGTAAFEGGRSPSRVLGQTERKLEALESKLRRKDEVIAQIMEDLVRTKKEIGESGMDSGSHTICATRWWIFFQPPPPAHRPGAGPDAGLARTLPAQIQSVARALRPRQRAQPHDCSRPLD